MRPRRDPAERPLAYDAALAGFLRERRDLTAAFCATLVDRDRAPIHLRRQFHANAATLARVIQGTSAPDTMTSGPMANTGWRDSWPRT